MSALPFRERSLPILIGLYGIGVGVSQSLMSFAATLLAVFALAEIVAAAWRPSDARPRFDASQLVALLLVIYLLADTLLRPFDPRSTGEALRWLPLFLVPLAATARTRPFAEPARRGVLATVAAAVCVSSLYAVGQFIASRGTAPGVAFFRNPIYLAYNLFPAFVFFAEGFFSDESPRWRKASGLVAVVVGGGLLASLNRFVPFCAAVYLAVKFFTLRDRTHRVAIGGLFAAAAGLGAAALAFSPAALEKVQRGISLGDLSLLGRVTIWKYNWSLFVANPVFGVGPFRNWVDVAEQTQWAHIWTPGVRIYAHSVYLQALADSGLVGLGLLLTALFLVARRHRVARTIFCVVFLLGGLTENILNNSKPFHALLFYLLLPLVIRPKRDASA